MTAGRRKRIYRAGLIVGLSLFLYQITVNLGGLSRLELSSTSLKKAVLVLTLATASQMIPTVGWGLLLRSIKKQVAWIEVIRNYPLSFLPRYIPGSVWGYLSRSEWLSAREGISYLTSSALSVIEVGMIVLTAVVVGSLMLIPPLGPNRWLIQVGALVAIGPGSWLALRALLQVGVIRTRLVGEEDGNTIATPKFGLYMLTLALYTGMWFLFGAALHYSLSLLGHPLGSPLEELTSQYAISWLAGFVVVIVPSGVGIRELILTSLLTRTPLANATVAGAAAIVMRVSLVLGELIWLALSQAVALVHLRHRTGRF